MYTPHEIGFWSEPDMVAFSEAVKNPDAGAGVSRLREYIMVRDLNDGRLPGHSREKIAAIMRPQKTCSLDKYFKELDRFNFLKKQRKTYYVPGWKLTAAGRYCDERIETAKRKAEWRKKQKEEDLQEVEQDGTGRSADGPGTVRGIGHSAVSKIGRDGDTPPAGPSGAGEGVADARFQWFWDLYPKRRDPAKCKKLLAQMDDESWQQLRIALPRHREIYMSRNARYVFPADKYLAKGTFWELAKETPRKSDGKSGGKPVVPPTPTPEQAKAKALDFLRQQLSDPDLPEKLKEDAKRRWRKTYDGEEPWLTWDKPHGKAKAAA